MQEKIRRLVERMKTRKRRIGIVCAGWALLAMPFAFRDVMPQIFVKNMTASMPVGLYLILPDTEFKNGDIVSFVPPKEAAALALERGWLEEKANFLKTVGALPGDSYTVTDKAIYINGAYIGPIYSADSKARPMPKLRGTYVVQDGHFLPVAACQPRSFDGRYFGEVPLSAVRCRVYPLLTDSILEVLNGH